MRLCVAVLINRFGLYICCSSSLQSGPWDQLRGRQAEKQPHCIQSSTVGFSQAQNEEITAGKQFALQTEDSKEALRWVKVKKKRRRNLTQNIYTCTKAKLGL